MSDKLKTLSAAMRLGATFRPQCFGVFSRGEDSCAMQAAMEAVGLPLLVDWPMWPPSELKPVKEAISSRWPFLGKRCACPQCGGRPTSAIKGGKRRNTLYAVVAHLNNQHKWSREQIADWLEGRGL